MAKKEMTKSEFETLIATIKKSSPGLADQLSMIAENSPKVFESGRSRFRKLVSRDENLTKITAEDLGEITIIGDHAFDGCTYLESIEIPLTVKSINKHAFYGTSLESITLPFVGEDENRDGPGAWHFSYIFGDGLNDQGYPTSGYVPSSLKTVIITGGTKINYNAFYYCSMLEKVVLPDTVEFIGGGTFNGCSSLETLTIPFVGEKKDGSGATHFGVIFGAQSYSGNENSVPSSLKTVIITGGSSIGSYAFRNCTSLKSITIPSSVTSIGEAAFSGCTSLEEVIFENGSQLTSIGKDAFFGCTSLNGVYISDVASWCNISFSGYYANPMDYAKNLYLNEELVTDLVIPDSVTSIGNYAFWGCESLTSITIPSSVTSIGSYAFRGCESLTSITIPSSVTSIGGAAFYNCDSLTSITIPSSVTSIGSYAFYNCKSLKSITIPSSVTSIGYEAFYYCTSLEEVIFENGSQLTSIGSYAFKGCTSLTSITIPSGVTSIGEAAFSYCTSLTSITIPSSVTSISSSAFYYCTSLESIEIPSSVTSIGESTFQYCKNLKSITIPSGVTSIGSSAFSYCSSLSSITIPSSVTSIGERAFYNCTSLKSITIPSSVTSIGEAAFYNCDSLTSITIPSGVTSIGEAAFYGCTSLNSVIFKDLYEWRCCQYGGTRETEISSADLSKKSTAATYLKSTYSGYSWFKNVTTV